MEKDVGLLGILPQIANVVGNPAQFLQVHAPLDAAVEGALFVKREIVPRPSAQDHDHLLQAAGALVPQRRIASNRQNRAAPEIADDLARQFLRAGHHIGQSRVNRAARHAIALGGGGRLDKDRSGLLLDGAQAQTAI